LPLAAKFAQAARMLAASACWSALSGSWSVASGGDEPPLFVMAGPVEDRHAGESPGGQRRPDRLFEHLAVDDARDRGGREVAHQVRDRKAAQAAGGLVGAARLGREGLALGLGGGEGLLRQRKGSALYDRPVEEPAGTAGDQGYWTQISTFLDRPVTTDGRATPVTGRLPSG
jgi:hypothetical protein